MPNGDRVAIWSPPWATETDDEGNEYDMDYDSPNQDKGALKFAQQLWETQNYKTVDVTKDEFLKAYIESGISFEDWCDNQRSKRLLAGES